MLDTIIESIRPAWVLVAIVGGFWASVVSALAPPPFRSVATVFLAGLVGAAIGQAIGEAGSVGILTIGDTQLLTASLVAMAAAGVVRRLVA